MQSQTLELSKTNIVRAGAGAGKTRNLTLRVLDWVEAYIKKHQSYPKLVVTTFTVKATQELRERLLLFASERENDELIEYVRSGAYLQISTIHGVLSSLLRRYGYAIGLDSGFEVLSGIENRKLGLSLLRKKLVEKPEFQALLETYNFNELIQFFDRYYEAYIYNPNLQALDKESIVNFIKTKNAKLIEESHQLSGKILNDLQSLGQENKTAINWQNMARGFSSIQEKSDINEAFTLWNDLITQVGRFPSNPAKKPVVYPETKIETKAFWDELKKFCCWESDLLPFLRDYERNAKLFHQLAKELFETYLEEKRSQSKISMADIELLSTYLMKEKPELAYAFSEEYDYWLIDEFQDTSPDQLKILRKLIDDRPYYVVGDPQQSIYFFRGADQSLFYKEEARINEQGGKGHLLMKNYRTKPSTMEFINDYMEQFGFSRMETRDSTELSSDNVAAEFLLMEEAEEENRGVANRIVELLNQGQNPSDICVLARTKKSLEDIAAVLREKSVPLYLHTSGSFFDRRENLDLLFLLKFLVHPFDNKNLIGLLRSPWFYVEDRYLYESSQYEVSLWEKLSEQSTLEPVNKLKELKTYSDEYGVLSALEKVLVESGMLELSREYDPSGKREANLWKMITDLREAEHKTFFNPLRMIRMAEEFATVSNEGETEAAAALEPNRVQLMTIHASKGLEFKHVFLSHMNKRANLTNSLNFYLSEDARFSLPVPINEEGTKRLAPLVQPQLEEIRLREKEESFRLLYVAMTRAEERLYLSWNGEPRSGSWIENLMWDLSEEKIATDRYSYLVSKSFSEIDYKESEKKLVEARPAWRDSLISMYQPVETESVSRLLEQRTEYGRQAKKGEESQFYTADDFHKRMEKAARGTRLHLQLEKYVAAQKLEKHLNFDSETQKFIDYLETDERVPFLDLIDKAQLEWGFVFKKGERTIEGQVDFWSEDSEGNLWVLDYKTGSARFKSKALEQLNIYAYALHKMYPQKNIFLAAVFVEEEISFVEEFSTEKLESLFK